MHDAGGVQMGEIRECGSCAVWVLVYGAHILTFLHLKPLVHSTLPCPWQFVSMLLALFFYSIKMVIG